MLFFCFPESCAGFVAILCCAAQALWCTTQVSSWRLYFCLFIVIMTMCTDMVNLDSAPDMVWNQLALRLAQACLHVCVSLKSRILQCPFGRLPCVSTFQKIQDKAVGPIFWSPRSVPDILPLTLFTGILLSRESRTNSYYSALRSSLIRVPIYLLDLHFSAVLFFHRLSGVKNTILPHAVQWWGLFFSPGSK